MEICDNEHDEVCYEGSLYTKCPVCKIIQEKQDEIDELTNERDDLQTQLKG